MKRTLLTVLVLGLAGASSAAALQPSVSEITDSRTTGQFFARMEVQLKLLGEEMSDVRGVRTNLKKAVDDTGKDLINPEKQMKEFEKFDSSYGGNTIKLELKNPARRAANIQELTGEIELFMPGKDPGAVVKVENFLAQAGKPISHPSLKQAKVDLTILTKEIHEAQEKKRIEEAKAAAKAQGMDESMIEAMTGFMGGFGGADENSLIVKLNDPQSQLVNMEILDKSGERISDNGSMTSGDTKTLYFSQKLPADATLALSILTPKSVTKVPLQLANVTLP